MKPVDIFRLFVRCVGLLLLLYGLYPLYLLLIGLIPGVASPTHAIGLLVWLGIPCLVAGIYFLSGAQRLVSFCYPPQDQEGKES